GINGAISHTHRTSAQLHRLTIRTDFDGKMSVLAWVPSSYDCTDICDQDRVISLFLIRFQVERIRLKLRICQRRGLIWARRMTFLLRMSYGLVFRRFTLFIGF